MLVEYSKVEMYDNIFRIYDDGATPEREFSSCQLHKTYDVV